VPAGGGPSKGERAEAEGTRAADTIKKNPSKQRPRDEASEVVSGAQAPDRPPGPTPAGTTPGGRTKEHDRPNTRESKNVLYMKPNAHDAMTSQALQNSGPSRFRKIPMKPSRSNRQPSSNLLLTHGLLQRRYEQTRRT
jgi:hypothetical protein